MATELLEMVEEHLAWQANAPEHYLKRQVSTGTLIVDWDGTGAPVISKRNKVIVEPLGRRIEVETKPEVLQARINPRRRSRYVTPLPLLTQQDQSMGRNKAIQRHDSV